MPCGCRPAALDRDRRSSRRARGQHHGEPPQQPAIRTSARHLPPRASPAGHLLPDRWRDPQPRRPRRRRRRVALSGERAAATASARPTIDRARTPLAQVLDGHPPIGAGLLLSQRRKPADGCRCSQPRRVHRRACSLRARRGPPPRHRGRVLSLGPGRVPQRRARLRGRSHRRTVPTVRSAWRGGRSRTTWSGCSPRPVSAEALERTADRTQPNVDGAAVGRRLPTSASEPSDREGDRGVECREQPPSWPARPDHGTSAYERTGRSGWPRRSVTSNRRLAPSRVGQRREKREPHLVTNAATRGFPPSSRRRRGRGDRGRCVPEPRRGTRSAARSRGRNAALRSCFDHRPTVAPAPGPLVLDAPNGNLVTTFSISRTW